MMSFVVLFPVVLLQHLANLCFSFVHHFSQYDIKKLNFHSKMNFPMIESVQIYFRTKIFVLLCVHDYSATPINSYKCTSKINVTSNVFALARINSNLKSYSYLASINFMRSTATVEETAGVVRLKLENNGSGIGTVCKYTHILRC